MSRHLLLSVAVAALAFAARPAAADSCVFESLEQGTAIAGASGGRIEIEDFSFDIEQTLNIGSQSSGSGAGKITFNPFQITKKVDSATPQLLRSALNGTMFSKVRCSFYGVNGANSLSPYLTAVLSNATINKVKVDGGGEGTPKVKFTFQYEKVEWEY